MYLPRVDEPPKPAAPVPAVTAVPRGSESILLAEDEDGLRHLVRKTLEGLGYTVIEAGHGGQALVLAEQHAGRLDLLMTDVIMPHMSGPELADRLAPLHPETRVLYMSGYTGEVIRYNEPLDPDLFLLQKPFTPDMLARKVREVCWTTLVRGKRCATFPALDTGARGSRSCEPNDGLDEVPTTMPGKRVLVVDDDAATVLLCSRLLQKAGYTTIIARDAGQAVTQAHRDQPALIITDLMMPAGGGLSVLERLAMSSKTSAIPIVVLTGSAETELERRATAAGALRVLKKPVEPTGLLDAVREAIGEPT